MTKSTFELILLIVFLVIVFCALIAGIVGLIKGIYKTTLKTILKAVLIFVLLCTAPSISAWIGNIDISRFVSGSEGTVTIFSYVVNYLYNSGLISPMNGMSLYETAIALATSALAFVTFFLGMILLQIFISLITAIFYHGIFRWFLPVETKKERKARKAEKKKSKEKSSLTAGLIDCNSEVETKMKKRLPLLRIPGGILGACQEFVFVCILVSPITAMARIAVTNRTTVKAGLEASGMDESQIQMADDFMDATEASLLYKVLGFKDFDLALMNKASSVKLNDTEVSLSGLLSSVIDIASPLLKDGTISYDKAAGNVSVNFSALLSTSTVDSLLTTLIRSPMVMALIPPLVDVALSSINGASFAIDELDFSGIQWDSELTIINGIYDEIYSGTIEPIVKDDAIDVKSFSLKTSTMSDEEMQTYLSAVSKLGTMESVKKNLPVILSGIGTYLENQGFSILPTSRDMYKDIDWSQDLKVFLESVLSYFRVIGMDIDSNFNANLLKDKTFECFKDEAKRKKIQSIICGETNHQGLLDTQLFSTMSLEKIVSSSLSAIPSLAAYVTKLDFSFLESMEKAALKTEFETMFEIAGIVFADDSKLNISNLTSLDFTDPETADALADLLEKSKASQIFQNLYPSVMKGILYQSNVNISSYLYGLTPYNFNYESKNFIDNFEDILRLMPSIKSMQDSLSKEGSTAEKLEGIDTDVLRNLLWLIVNSDFFNAEQRTGIASGMQKNVNIYTFFSNLFQEDAFSGIGLVCPSFETMQSLNWGDDNGRGGEIDKLVSMIELAKKNPEFLTTKELRDIKDTKAISDLLKTGFESDLLSPSILSIIDNSLAEYLDSIGIPYSLNEMRNALWIADSDDIGELICLLKGVDLDNLDFATFSPDRLNALLTLFSKMNIIQTGNSSKDPFGYALYSILSKQGFFSDLGMVEDSSVFLLDDVSSWSKETEEALIDEGEEKFLITKTGEIKYFVDFFKVMQDVGFDSLKGGTIPEGFVSSISDCMQSQILRKVMVSILKKTMTTISLPDGYGNILNGIDVDLLLNLTPEEFTNELNIFESIYRLSSSKINGQSKLELMLNNFYTLSTISVGEGRTLEDDMDDLIGSLTTSVLFTTVKLGENLNAVSLLLSAAFEKMDMVDKVTMVKSASLQKEALNGILATVDDWKAEGVTFQRILHEMQGMESSGINLVGSRMTKEKASTMLNLMNESHLFHRVPASLFRNAFEQKDLSAYLRDPETGMVTHPFVFDTHLSTSKEDIAYWKNDIDMGVELMLGDGGFSSVFDADAGTIEDIDFLKINTSALYYIGSMHLFEKNRSYLLYNLIDSYSTDDFSANSLFLDGTDVPYGYPSKVYRFENLFFSNPKLLASDGTLDKDLALMDLSLLNGVLHIALEKAPEAIRGSNLKDVDIDFISLTESCYRLESGVLYRSDFASELLAGIETEMVKNPNYTRYFSALSDVNFYADDYKLINLIEARAFEGFLTLAKAPTTSYSLYGTSINYYSKATLTPIFAFFGTDTAPEDHRDIYQYFIALSDYSATPNAVIAKKTSSIIGLLPVLGENGTSGTLSSFATGSTDSISFTAYLSAAPIQ